LVVLFNGVDRHWKLGGLCFDISVEFLDYFCWDLSAETTVPAGFAVLEGFVIGWMIFGCLVANDLR